MDRKVRKNERVLLVLSLMAFFLFSLRPALAADQNIGTVVALTNQADKAEDMLAHDYFAHTSPQGTTPWSWFDKSGYDYKYAGENLAMGFVSLPDQQQAWMNSTEHRKNILNPNFQDIGVAVVQGRIDGAETTLTVEEFGAPFAAVVSNNPGGSVLANEAFNGGRVPQMIADSPMPSVNIGVMDISGRTAGFNAALLIFAFIILANPVILIINAFQPIMKTLKKKYALAAGKRWKILGIIPHMHKLAGVFRK